MKSVSMEPQVIGQYILSIIKNSPDKQLTEQICKKVGFKTIEPLKWYPQILFIRFFIKLTKIKGDDYLFNLGKALIVNSEMPPNVQSFSDAISSLDLGYTVSHRNQIGSMFGLKSSNDFQMEIVSANPYPCPFDWGILQALANKYHPGGKLAHDFSKGCRLDGDTACHYTLSA